MSEARPAAAVADQVARVRWYHTLELPGGVATPGEYDLRPVLRRVPLPASLAGKRCLDVGTHDGFWAFEMERRGAAEVVAIDLDDPDRLDWPLPAPRIDEETRAAVLARGAAFDLAHRALGSAVQRRDLSVYDLPSEEVGRFDFATIGTLLLHLRDPIAALAAIRSVLDGELLCNDSISLALTLRAPRRPLARLAGRRGLPYWWTPNIAALRRYVEAAGFELVRSGGPYLVANGAGATREATRPGGMLTSRLDRLALRFGMPHAWILARA